MCRMNNRIRVKLTGDTGPVTQYWLIKTNHRRIARAHDSGNPLYRDISRQASGSAITVQSFAATETTRPFWQSESVGKRIRANRKLDLIHIHNIYPGKSSRTFLQLIICLRVTLIRD